MKKKQMNQMLIATHSMECFILKISQNALIICVMNRNVFIKTEQWAGSLLWGSCIPKNIFE